MRPPLNRSIDRNNIGDLFLLERNGTAIDVSEAEDRSACAASIGDGILAANERLFGESARMNGRGVGYGKETFARPSDSGCKSFDQLLLSA
jgi:hypothetical protein